MTCVLASRTDLIMRNFVPAYYHGDNATQRLLSANFNRSEAGMDEILHLYNVARIMILIFHPLLLMFGLIGNTLSFCVLIRRVKHSSTYTYLCSLCVADNLFIIGFCMYWLVQAGSNGEFNLFDVDCNFTNFLMQFMSQMSAWLLVCVTLERVLVLYLPSKAKTICKPARARIVLLVLVIILSVINFPVFGGLMSRQIEEPRPDTNEFYQFTICIGVTDSISVYIDEFYLILDSIIYSYAPTLILIVLNIMIVYKFIRAHKRRVVEQMPVTPMSPATATAESSDHPSPPMSPDGDDDPPEEFKYPRSIKILCRRSVSIFVLQEDVATRTLRKNSGRMTRMALAVSVTFLVATMPICVAYFFIPGDHEEPTSYREAVLYVVGHTLSLLMIANHSCNFIMYCMTSEVFRRHLKDTLKRCCQPKEF